MKRRTAILAAAGVSLALVGASSAVAFGTDLFGPRGNGGPGALPPVVNAQTAAGSAAQQAPGPESAAHREGAERDSSGEGHDSGSHDDDNVTHETLAGHSEDD